MVILRSGKYISNSDNKNTRNNKKKNVDKDEGDDKYSFVSKSEYSSEQSCEEDSDEDSEFDELSEDEEVGEWLDETYNIPNDIKDDEKLTENFNRIVKKIKSSEPSLEDILNLRIRMKRKIYLLQKFYIYKNTFPYTEERYFLKMELLKKIQMYQTEHKEFKKNKDRYKILENSKIMDSDLMVMKSNILKLESNKENLKIIFQKFNQLESRNSTDEEFYKAYYIRLIYGVYSGYIQGIYRE